MIELIHLGELVTRVVRQFRTPVVRVLGHDMILDPESPFGSQDLVGSIVSHLPGAGSKPGALSGALADEPPALTGAGEELTVPHGAVVEPAPSGVGKASGPPAGGPPALAEAGADGAILLNDPTEEDRPTSIAMGGNDYTGGKSGDGKSEGRGSESGGEGGLGRGAYGEPGSGAGGAPGSGAGELGSGERGGWEWSLGWSGKGSLGKSAGDTGAGGDAGPRQLLGSV